MVQSLFCILFLIFFVSCGKRDFPDYSDYELPPQFEVVDGQYPLSFTSLNNIPFSASGILWVRENQFYVKIVTVSSRPLTRYQQYVHKGSRCPGKDDDENGDGVIDYREVMNASGPMFIPLDGKLNSRLRGLNWFPQSDKKGKYYYSRSGILNNLMEDLFSNEADSYGFANLEATETLNISQRVILIYGNDQNPLFPVACAVLNRPEVR